MDTQDTQNPSVTVPGSSVSHNTLMGVLSYLGILVIIPLLVAKDDPFVKFHAKQGLVLLGIEIVVWVVFSFVWVMWLLGNLINLGVLVLAILGIVNAVRGEQKELPLVGSLAHYLTF
jgi:uncharacterized membrane protein